MMIYFFKSRDAPSVRAFTVDGTGRNLPMEYAPWEGLEMSASMASRSLSKSIKTAVQRDGYFLISGNPRSHSGRKRHA